MQLINYIFKKCKLVRNVELIPRIIHERFHVLVGQLL